MFSTFSRDTQKGTSTCQDPVTVPGSRFPLTVYTGFSKETALSTRVDAFTSTPLYRGGCVCGRGPQLNVLPNVCADSVAVFYLMNFCNANIQEKIPPFLHYNCHSGQLQFEPRLRNVVEDEKSFDFRKREQKKRKKKS